MRNGSATQSWGDYVKTLRTAAGLSVQDVADRIGSSHSTVWRWENRGARPETSATPEAVAALFGRPADEALERAGLRSRTHVEAPPVVEVDPDLRDILESGLPKRIQQELIAHVREQRQRDEQRRIEEARTMIRIAGGRVA